MTVNLQTMASTSGSQAAIAQKTWEMANNIETISSVDEIYRYDRKQQQDILTAKPWDKEWVTNKNITRLELCTTPELIIPLARILFLH